MSSYQKFLDLHKVLAVLILIIVSTSCTENKAYNDQTLLGKWQWKSSSGGIVGSTETPASTGKNIDLKLTSDGKYFYFTNGIITSQGTYNLGTQNCIHDQTNKKIIIFSNDALMMLENIDKSNLLLSDENYDGFSYSYIRK